MTLAATFTVGAITALLTAAMAPDVANAGCDVDVPRIVVSRGSLARGARCGSFVIATDAAGTRTSEGRAGVVATIPYTLSLVARRLTGDGTANVQLELHGGYFMWRDGAWGIYVDEAQFARDGWQAAPGLDSRRDHRVVVERTAGEVAITFDGVALGRWPMVEPRGSAPSIGLTGRRGARARLLVRELSLTPGRPR